MFSHSQKRQTFLKLVSFASEPLKPQILDDFAEFINFCNSKIVELDLILSDESISNTKIQKNIIDFIQFLRDLKSYAMLVLQQLVTEFLQKLNTSFSCV